MKTMDDDQAPDLVERDAELPPLEDDVEANTVPCSIDALTAMAPRPQQAGAFLE